MEYRPQEPDSHHRVLIVEDSAPARRTYARLISRAGFVAEEAADGCVALEMIAAQAPDLVLLDQSMPGLSGFEVLERLRQDERTKTLPVVVLTAQSTVEERVQALEAGASDYLEKTIESSELIARVRAHLLSHDAWARRLEEDGRTQGRLAALLGGLPSSGTPEDSAAVLCSTAALVGDAFGAALLALDDDGTCRTLAAEGFDQRGADAWCPGKLAAQELLRLCDGQDAAILVGEEISGGLRPRSAPETLRLLAAALRSGEDVLGFLLIAADEQEIERAAVVATQVAAHAAARLGPTLLEARRLDAARAGIERMLVQGAFGPVFQPIFRAGSRELAGHEALTRFEGGSRPDLAFAEASRVGLGPTLELATLRCAVAEARTLPIGGFLSLNVTAELLEDAAAVAETLAGADRPITLEITEHERIEDYEAVRAAVADVTNRVGGGRIRLAVDDAGAGFASLQHILALSPDLIKLDRGLVSGVDRDPDRRALVAGLVHYARDCGSVLLGEGIETAEELAALESLGIDLAQGYLLGKPEPAPTPVI